MKRYILIMIMDITMKRISSGVRVFHVSCTRLSIERSNVSLMTHPTHWDVFFDLKNKIHFTNLLFPTCVHVNKVSSLSTHSLLRRTPGG